MGIGTPLIYTPEPNALNEPCSLYKKVLPAHFSPSSDVENNHYYREPCCHLEGRWRTEPNEECYDAQSPDGLS